MKVKQLTELGIREFSTFLERLRNGEVIDVPKWLLVDSRASSPVADDLEVDEVSFENKEHIATYFLDLMAEAESVYDAYQPIWSWLSLFFFEQLSPSDESGIRRPGEDYRFILSSDYRHRYRHLLAGPYRIKKMYPHSAKCLLSGPINKPGEFNEQVASRLEIMANSGIVDAIDRLYYDKAKGRPKRGARAKDDKPGVLRRLIPILQQFDLTYDLQSMSSEQILDMLPAEFDSWKA